MQTVTIELFKFNELSEDAKQTAIDNYRYNNDGGAIHEVIASANAAVELFNLKTGNEYSAVRHSHIDDCILELKGIRAYKYILNNYGNKLFKPKFIKSVKGHKFYNQVICERYDFTKYGNGLSTFIYSKNRVTDSCVLTGVCYDDDILQPVYDFLAKPCKYTTIQDIFEQLGEAIAKTFADYEDWVNSDEYISEFFEGNDYDFTIDGKRY
jgi:hypothetical protein